MVHSSVCNALACCLQIHLPCNPCHKHGDITPLGCAFAAIVIASYHHSFLDVLSESTSGSVHTLHCLFFQTPNHIIVQLHWFSPAKGKKALFWLTVPEMAQPNTSGKAWQQKCDAGPVVRKQYGKTRSRGRKSQSPTPLIYFLQGESTSSRFLGFANSPTY